MFTQTAIDDSIAKYPKFNWVICHSPYSTAFDGVEGTDWGHTHHELGISLGRTIGSEFLTYLQYFSLITFSTGTIFIGQGQEHSIDMEMVDISMYVPYFSNL